MDLLKEVTLGSLRDTLVRLEDTITFGKIISLYIKYPDNFANYSLAFIERAQFCTNQKIYEPGALAFDTGFNGTFLEYFLHEVETVHGN
jgi:chorismate mutase